MEHDKLFIGLILGLVLGGGAGYYSGSLLGEAQGQTEAVRTLTVNYVPPNHHADTATAANPFEAVQADPLAEVHVNPFDY